jgi:hypothetical protein
MLGPVKSRQVDQPVTTSLDALVPADRFYRHLEHTLDLGFVRELVRDAYAVGGRPSIDPIVFFKLELILFFEGIRSDRQLIETASLNLAHRWYLGYALDEPLPDLLWRTRCRWHRHPTRIIGNTTYGTTDHIRLVEDAGIRAHSPLPDWGRTPYSGPARFLYDAGQDEYRRPQGQPLHRYTAKHEAEVAVYRAAPATCNACSVKAACTASGRGRTLQRSFWAEYLERVRGYHRTAAYR